MSLKRYKSKRNLAHSHEPGIKIHKRKKGSLQFVIHKHAARRLHYDLRLEVDGVLKSWAIPKGPSLNPKIKRLAIHVEDHPFDYKDFEGVIPHGYGAGGVLIWDSGTYASGTATSFKESEKEMRQGLKKGELHFVLQGEKLHGGFTLIRLKKEEDEWLLIKKKDDYASEEEITKKEYSAASRRTLEQLSGKKSKKPHHLKPMLATLIAQPFDGEEWIFEIKWDGYRALAEIGPNKVDLYSRNLHSFNRRFPSIVEALNHLKIDAIVDGEIVALDSSGIAHFQWLQDNKDPEHLYYYIFDLLYLQGRDLRALPLIERKAKLRELLGDHPTLRYLDHIEGNGKAFLKECQKRGIEGIIGKKKESHYLAGERSHEWVKIKNEPRQEMVICGFTEPRKGRKNFGALILGVYKKKKLTYAGHVGGGFTERELKRIKEKLLPLVQTKCPFATIPHTNTPVTWVKPRLLCEVKFREWTNEGILRQPIFLGLREDKEVKEVEREQPKENFDFLTHLDKTYWQKEKITKGELLGYYYAMAPYILPYLKDHPVSLKRFPNGIARPSFFQKNLQSPPSWIKTVEVEHHEKKVNYLLIQDTQSLLYAVNLGSIELHPWLSRTPTLDFPEWLLFDLDPEAISFEAVIATAQIVHRILDRIDVPNFCKTSGASGLHIYVPLKGKYTFEQAKQFALLVATVAEKELPEVISLERAPKNRQKKVYIDCLQNNYGQTVATPYSIRAKPGAPVATPLSWNEVKTGLDPLDFNLFTLPARVKKKGDLLHALLERKTDMATSLQKLKKTYFKT